MKIGRLMFERPCKDIPSMISYCGCRFISLPFVFITWFAPNCKCVTCKQYVCECICPLCYEKVIKCKCVRF